MPLDYLRFPGLPSIIESNSRRARGHPPDICYTSTLRAHINSLLELRMCYYGPGGTFSDFGCLPHYLEAMRADILWLNSFGAVYFMDYRVSLWLVPDALCMKMRIHRLVVFLEICACGRRHEPTVMRSSLLLQKQTRRTRTRSTG